jgi:hypothetical protein
MGAPSSVRPASVHPARAALEAAPKGDAALLTPDDRARIEANRRAGNPGVPHAELMAKLEERRRSGK